jgi:hypothetical protein
MIYRINPCCLHGQYVSAHIAHLARLYPMWSSVSDILYQSMLSTRSVCLSIYCLHGRVAHIMLLARASGSQYVAHVGEWLMIYRINPCGLHGQYVSAYIAHVVRVYTYNAHVIRVSRHISHQSMLSMWSNGSQYIVSIHAVYMVSMSQHILPTWSEHIPYNLMWSKCIPYNPVWSSVTRYIAHIVRVSHNILYQSMLSTRSVPLSVCLTIYRINRCCPCSHVAHNISPTWPECIIIYCINSWCPCGRVVHYVLSRYH